MVAARDEPVTRAQNTDDARGSRARIERETAENGGKSRACGRARRPRSAGSEVRPADVRSVATAFGRSCRRSIEAELAQALQERRVRDAEQVRGGEATTGGVREDARHVRAIDYVEGWGDASRVRVDPEEVIVRRRLAMARVGDIFRCELAGVDEQLRIRVISREPMQTSTPEQVGS